MQYKHATLLLILVLIGTGILTIAVFERRERIAQMEELGLVDIGALPSTTDTVNAELQPNQYRALDIDLDGDGVVEQIALTSVNDDVNGTITTITVNDQSMRVNGNNNQGYFGIVDFDVTDTQQEIAVSDLGPSSDYTTAFYTWNGDEQFFSKFVDLGTTSDLWENMRIDGDGTFEVLTRAMVLDTWFYYDTIELKGETLTRVPQEFYARVHSGEDIVTALVPLSFQTSPIDTTTSMVLAVGEQAQVLGCDHVEAEEAEQTWCKITDMGTSNNVGWFKITDIDLQNDFSGFSFAD